VQREEIMRGVLAAVVVLAATLTLRADPVTDEFNPVAASRAPLAHLRAPNRDPDDQGSVSQEFKARWATTKAFTLEVADAMPEADYGFKPTPGEMTFGALMWHIAIANEFRFSQVAGVAFQPPAGPLPSDKPTILKGLAASFDHCAAIADKLTSAQLDASYPVDWVGMPTATGRQILLAMFTHTAHHRGQAEVYLRLKGIVPPKYRY
jgi:uncharacterized damage-inducible protein DinB